MIARVEYTKDPKFVERKPVCLLEKQRNSRRGRLILHRFCPKPRLHKFKEIKEEIGWH